MSPSIDDIAILRIELEGIEPLIWRRIAVRTSMTLKAVHSVIQAAMGWLDCHLWEFEANDRKYSMLIPDDPEWNRRITDAASTKLYALLTTGMREMSYLYDMGDSWQHRIIVEKLKATDLKRHTRSSSVGKGDARLRIAAASPAITNSWTISPASRARNAKPPSIGTEDRMIRMTLARRRSSLP